MLHDVILSIDNYQKVRFIKPLMCQSANYRLPICAMPTVLMQMNRLLGIDVKANVILYDVDCSINVKYIATINNNILRQNVYIYTQ